MSIMTDVLISNGTTYDMLLGLNVCEAIGAIISSTHLRYNVKINDKEWFGKIPIIKKPANKPSWYSLLISYLDDIQSYNDY